ncbi:hypothetical protein J3F83DRAFT_557959 [Trichoderma novae-zelandiae]
MDTQSYGLVLFLFPLSPEFGLGAMAGFSFLHPFFSRLFKRQISFKGDLYYHPMHMRGRRPRHGAFFHLEIPSVIILGASRANEGRETERVRGGLKKRRQGGEVVCLHDFLSTDLILSFHLFSFTGFSFLGI